MCWWILRRGPQYILKYNIYTYSHDLISCRVLASGAPTLWGSAGHLFSNVHKALSINLNLGVYSTGPCHLDYTKSPSSLPINHWNHVQKASGIISGNSLLLFPPPLSSVSRSSIVVSLTSVAPQFVLPQEQEMLDCGITVYMTWQETRQGTRHCKSKTCAQRIGYLVINALPCTKPLLRNWALNF